MAYLEFRDRNSKPIPGHTRTVRNFSYTAFVSGGKHRENLLNHCLFQSSRDSNPLRESVELFFLYSVYDAFSASRFDCFSSAFSNEISEHLHPTHRVNKAKCGTKYQVPRWCREAHRHSQDGTALPIHGDLNRTST